MASEDVTVGEIYRLLQATSATVERLSTRLDSFGKDFVRADLYEVMVGSTRMELTRVDHTLKEAEAKMSSLEMKHDKDIAQIREAADARFRQLVTAVVGSFVGPIATGLIIFYLTNK